MFFVFLFFISCDVSSVFTWLIVISLWAGEFFFKYKLYFRRLKKKIKTLFYGCDRSTFYILGDVFYFNFVKILWNQPFFDRNLKILIKICWKRNQNIFQNYFCKKPLIFQNFCVFRVIFATRKRKILKKFWPTDPTWEVRP